MNASRRVLLGGVTAALGLALLVFAASDLNGLTRSVHAGESVDCTQAGISPTAVPTATPDPTAIITDFQALQQIPTCTPTVVIRRTRTPSPEPTEEATQTSAPEPTQPPAPTATRPSGGAGGVQAPDTGTGDAASRSSLTWLLLSAGAALAAMGAGAVVAGARKRAR